MMKFIHPARPDRRFDRSGIPGLPKISEENENVLAKKFYWLMI